MTTENSDPFINKKIGVVLTGPEWLFLIAFLQHTCTDAELVKDLWENKEDYEEMVFTIRQIQRQVFLVTEKIKTPDAGEGLKGKILSIKNKLIGADGRPLS